MQASILVHYLPTDVTWQSAWEDISEQQFEHVQERIIEICHGGVPFELTLESGSLQYFPITVVEQCVFKLMVKEDS